MIGATREAIDKAEDRDLFRQAMRKIGLDMPRSAIAHSIEGAHQVQAQIRFPTIIRPSFTMGGWWRYRLQPRGIRRDLHARA